MPNNNIIKQFKIAETEANEARRKLLALPNGKEILKSIQEKNRQKNRDAIHKAAEALIKEQELYVTKKTVGKHVNNATFYALNNKDLGFDIAEKGSQRGYNVYLYKTGENAPDFSRSNNAKKISKIKKQREKFTRKLRHMDNDAIFADIMC